MTQSSEPYEKSFVSSRSRRLRTAAAVLFVILIVMGVFGVTFVLPRIMHAAASARALQQQHAAGAGAPGAVRRDARIVGMDLVVLYSFWAVWAALAIALFLVCWMDLREVSRVYLEKRKDLWNLAAREALTKEQTSPGDLQTDQPPKEPDNATDGSLPPQ